MLTSRTIEDLDGWPDEPLLAVPATLRKDAGVSLLVVVRLAPGELLARDFADEVDAD